jgi:hypothetical protein
MWNVERQQLNDPAAAGASHPRFTAGSVDCLADGQLTPVTVKNL